MKVAILGRTRWLLSAARALSQSGHSIGFVATSKAADYETVGPDDFRLLADESGCGFVRTATLGSPDILAMLREAACDVGLSLNWNRILDRAEIEIFPHGILNVHAGDLPRYRGNAVVNWAILNGEDHIGLCLHRMEPNIVDAGEIIQRLTLSIDSGTYIGDVYGWLERAVPDLVVAGLRTLSSILSRSGGGIFEGNAVGLRCYPRRPEDSRIDWSQDAETVHRLIRASSEPFAGAYSTYEGQQTVRIWRAELVNSGEPFLAIPGQIMDVRSGYPVIACGRGCIRLSRVSVDGVPGESDSLGVFSRSVRNRLI